MYFVDRKKLEQRLTYIEGLLTYLASQEQLPEDVGARLALERAAHMSIEAILDVGNQMIDGFIMRDPGSYEDIIDILTDEQVVDQQVGLGLVKWIQLRKSLVTEYEQVQAEVIWSHYQEVRSAMESFPTCVRLYLNEQLGPVSAFLPE
ncbi:DUF86 domain-containing protein [Caldalkalibacillus mannanilyticus]|uniref:DUF86 domain-containing protein n=1 Tax=Caldalkalibacillus mannanilyticus TaxID=1418 RepID=UPI000468CF5B|nr:DUF86 domain-containing protein [Caldalkalibacillus mannanilyticus]